MSPGKKEFCLKEFSPKLTTGTVLVLSKLVLFEIRVQTVLYLRFQPTPSAAGGGAKGSRDHVDLQAPRQPTLLFFFSFFWLFNGTVLFIISSKAQAWIYFLVNIVNRFFVLFIVEVCGLYFISKVNYIVGGILSNNVDRTFPYNQGYIYIFSDVLFPRKAKIKIFILPTKDHIWNSSSSIVVFPR